MRSPARSWFLSCPARVQGLPLWPGDSSVRVIEAGLLALREKTRWGKALVPLVIKLP